MRKRERDYYIRHNKSPTDLGHCNLEEIRNRRKRENFKSKDDSSELDTSKGNESSRGNLEIPIKRRAQKEFAQSTNATSAQYSDRSVSRNRIINKVPSEKSVKSKKDDQDDYTLVNIKSLAFKREYLY